MNWKICIESSYEIGHFSRGAVRWNKKEAIPAQQLVRQHMQEVHLALEPATRGEQGAAHECGRNPRNQVSGIEKQR